ncbi:MAG: hypothetical protein WCP97_07330 [bacterium]
MRSRAERPLFSNLGTLLQQRLKQDAVKPRRFRFKEALDVPKVEGMKHVITFSVGAPLAFIDIKINSGATKEEQVAKLERLYARLASGCGILIASTPRVKSEHFALQRLKVSIRSKDHQQRFLQALHAIAEEEKGNVLVAVGKFEEPFYGFVADDVQGNVKTSICLRKEGRGGEHALIAMTRLADALMSKCFLGKETEESCIFHVPCGEGKEAVETVMDLKGQPREFLRRQVRVGVLKHGVVDILVSKYFVGLQPLAPKRFPYEDMPLYEFDKKDSSKQTTLESRLASMLYRLARIVSQKALHPFGVIEGDSVIVKGDPREKLNERLLMGLEEKGIVASKLPLRVAFTRGGLPVFFSAEDEQSKLTEDLLAFNTVEQQKAA